MRHVDIWGKSTTNQGNSMDKSPEVGAGMLKEEKKGWGAMREGRPVELIGSKYYKCQFKFA